MSFGVVIPGRPPANTFECIGLSRWVLPVSNLPSDMIVLYLTEPLPDGATLTAYLTPQGQNSFEYLGFVTNDAPSAILRIPISFLDQHRNTDVVLGLSLETVESARNLEESEGTSHSKQRLATQSAIASRIVNDFTEYVGSFSRSSSACGYGPRYDNATGEEVLVLPSRILGQWRDRIETKMNKDAQFWLAKGT
eukprot:PhM_4_TR2755/c0_g3_i2/m.29847